MKRFIVSSTIPLVLIALAVYSIMSWWGPAYQWRQKLTVTVETPEGLKSGSAVTEVTVHHNRIFKDGAEWQTDLRGEAVVVDLGSNKFLFVLLGTADEPQSMERLAQEIMFGQNTPRTGEEMYERIQATQGVMLVPESLYPVFVTFENLNDPASVKPAFPAALDTTFGLGHKLRSVQIEVTEEVQTKLSVKALLGWLTNSPEPRLCKTTGTRTRFCQGLEFGNFIRS
jgi:hypothetical protein